jgi:hypothetical protein
MVLALLVWAGCSSQQPRLLRVPEAGLPSRPEAATGCARAVFELPLNAAGEVVAASMRILVWEDDPGDPNALVRLRARAAASRWEIPESSTSESPGPIVARAVLRLDCDTLAADATVREWGYFEARLRQSQQVRFVAAEYMDRTTGAAWSEYDLDCLWTDLQSYRRGPFLHDAVEGWERLEPRLQAAQDNDGGLWVCRAARSTHTGQFIYLDAQRRVLAVARYWLGE